MSIHGHDINDLRSAERQRARLVERDCAQFGRHFDERAALDQDAVASSCRHARDDADRRGDHERAGTSDNQQHERPVKPDAEITAAKKRWQRRHDDCRSEIAGVYT